MALKIMSIWPRGKTYPRQRLTVALADASGGKEDQHGSFTPIDRRVDQVERDLIQHAYWLYISGTTYDAEVTDTS